MRYYGDLDIAETLAKDIANDKSVYAYFTEFDEKYAPVIKNIVESYNDRNEHYLSCFINMCEIRC